ncbi:3-hydroxybenzoate 6-hydroxylase 1 [Pseudocercospora fuligena]|uniref:3-hydroxybenzoate 6-hydroxylase 1 n=1 Tax=Pseudocercospora fuligena TaxID=685502 RepID=A0A8H6RBX6_9PEZI|nr:3-hydroxybenzoate 6-hydroxylase 1 [Pseudocercospora fuligena]
MGSISNPLKVGIIGAGIAGLCAGIAVSRAGHKATIYEKSSFKNEIGAAISITPNGNRVLSKWGFNYAAAGETDKCQFRGVDPVSMQLRHKTDLRDVRKDFGEGFNAFHRVDLHRELRLMAEKAGVEIVLSHEVVDLQCEDGIIKFKDGKEVKKDLVVVADGLKSNFIQTVTATNISPKKIGKSVFRGLIPISDLMSDPIIAPYFENEGSGFFSGYSPLNSGVMFITYPCRNDEIMNVAVFHTTRSGHEDDEGWSSPATIDEVLSVLDGLHPFWSQIVKKGDDDLFKCFSITFRDAIPRYSNGRVILMGDAAHPMQPTHAQGACVSIEDAATLETFLSQVQSSDIPSLCQLYSDFRIPRDNTTQLYSNVMFYKNDGDPEAGKKYEAEIRKYYPAPDELMTFVQTPWEGPHQRFWYGYHVYEEAKKAMEWWKTRKEGERLPRGIVKHFFNMGVREGDVEGGK